jgi:putative oxidoreductase
MNFIVTLVNRILNLLKYLTCLPPLLARITVGYVFIESGWGKLHHIEKVVDFFTSLGLKAPVFQAHLVANTEFIGGCLLVTGLFTRFACIPLSIIMVVAIRTARMDDLHGFSDLVGFTEYLYLLLMVWLVIAGPGSVSFDKLLARKFRRG